MRYRFSAFVTTSDLSDELVWMAYNLMCYLRNAITVSKVKYTLPTLKFRCIAIGAYLASTGRQKKLMLAVSGSKRDYIDSLFQKIKKYKPQLEQSTA